MSVIVPKCASLFSGLSCSGDDVLFQNGLNPKARRKVCQVCNEGDKGAAGIDVRPALTDLPVEVRNHGNEQIAVCRMRSRLVLPSVQPFCSKMLYCCWMRIPVSLRNTSSRSVRC